MGEPVKIERIEFEESSGNFSFISPENETIFRLRNNSSLEYVYKCLLGKTTMSTNSLDRFVKVGEYIYSRESPHLDFDCYIDRSTLEETLILSRLLK